MNYSIRRHSRRSTPIYRRDREGLNALHRIKVRLLCKNMEWLISLLRNETVYRANHVRSVIIGTLVANYFEFMRIMIIEVPNRPNRLERIRYFPMTFAAMQNHITNIGVEVSTRFRFQSFDEMRRFIRVFRFPNGTIQLSNRYTSTAEEILLISLTRLSFPLRWSDMYERFPGRKDYFLSRAFYWFIDFMISNWAYLLLNNMEWWKHRLFESCEAIRIKLQNLNHENWRQFHNQFDFSVALFIDCTMMAFCRPAGNLMEGPAAPRVPQEVQEAWYNGWKKLFGMKWQTVMLACGMDFQIYGPTSVRRNDLTLLDKSDIEQKLRDLFEDGDHIFKIFGDSAYIVSDVMDTHESLQGRGMSSVRETIEWSYKDVKVLWKYCDYKHILQMRRQPVAKIFFVCLLLRNVIVTLHGSQASDYLNMIPPTLEEWTSQGPCAQPIPDDNIFSPNFIPDPADELDYDDIDSDLDSDDDNAED